MTLQEYNDIFKNSPTKQIKITTSSELEIENENIISESMSLEGSLYSEQKMRFGSCEATCFNVTIADINHDFTGEWLTVTMSVDGIENPLNIGRFKVFSDKPTNDRRWRELTCYDTMYDIINSNVKSWFDNLTFPMTIKNLRDSLFTELGIAQVTTTLVNDNFVTEGEFYVDGTVSAKDILVAICELNGVFGHINANGQFEYIDLTNAETLTYDWYIDGTGSYEDYVTDTITGIIARGSDEDVGTTVGTTTNPYVIQNNPLVFGREGTTELETALTNLLTKISAISFRPFGVETYGNPMLPLGTQITLNTRDKTIVSYVMRKYMSGIQGLKDRLSASATQKQENYVNSIQSKITRTGGKIHKVVSEVDRLESEIIDFEQNVSTSITQLSNEIVLKVQNDGSLALVQLGADPSTGETAFVVKAGNFSVDAAGNVFIAGDITAKSKLTMRNAGNISGEYFNTDVIKITYQETAPLSPGGIPPLNLENIDICDYEGNSHVTFFRYLSAPGPGMTVHDQTHFEKGITVAETIGGNAVYTKSSVGDLGWGTAANRTKIPDMSAFAYWNGCYSGTSSNLQYCDRGRFGTASIVNTPISIANGGTGASDRLNAVKNLTNQNVGSSAQYFITITTNWAKAGYTSVGDAKTVLGISNGGPGSWFNRVPQVGGDGVLEIGKYIDFHLTNASTDDTNFRFTNTEHNKLYSSGAITQGSSRKIKENIKPIDEEEALKILELEPVSFDYKEKFGGGKDHRGFIAEDVDKILPNLTTPEYGDESDLKHFTPMSLTYTEMIPYLVKVAQMQQKKIESLEERISKLEGMIKTLIMKGEK